MIDMILPAFTNFGEFASTSSGGKVMFATDDFFAPCENMISDTDPVFITDKYTEFGKWMDGWETRRKRGAGHDWCILKLATKCVIRGFLLDTAHFTGNYAPKYSIQAACLGKDEENLIPERDGAMGSACSSCDLENIRLLKSDSWEEIVPKTPLRPGYEETRINYQKVVNDEAWTHIRLNIYPDGGIARLRVYGEAKPVAPASDKLVDLSSLLNGGQCLGYSNAHYGHPSNMIKPAKSRSMSDGWETARRLDRPEIIEADNEGNLTNVPGTEWAVFKQGFAGKIMTICVDTAHFKGNYPDCVKIEGTFMRDSEWTEDCAIIDHIWKPLLKSQKLSADKEHWYNCDTDVVSHIRVSMAPDGGISRIRTFGFARAI